MLVRLLLALALVVGGACSGGGDDDEGLTVLAASSLFEVGSVLTGAFSRAHGETITKRDTAYGPSSRLAAQVDEGATADVVLAADDVSLRRLRGVQPEPFATTHMVVAVAPHNPAGVKSVHDLARVRFVMAAPAVPAGRYAEQVLAKAGVTVRPVSHEPSAQAVKTKLANHEADAALVYATDARFLTSLPLDPRHDVTVTYTLAVIDASPEGRLFADFVRGAEGRRLLQAAGFGVP